MIPRTVTAAAFTAPSPGRAVLALVPGTAWACRRPLTHQPVAPLRRQRAAGLPPAPPAPGVQALPAPARAGGLAMQAGSGGGGKTEKSTSPFVRGITAFLLAAFLAGSFVPFLPTLTAFIKGEDTAASTSVLDARLRKVRVFAVTDGEGKPYLTVDEAAATAAGVGGGNGAATAARTPGAVGYFFLDVADAGAYLDAVRAQLPADEAASATAPVLFPVGLDEALAFTAPSSSSAATAARRASNVGISERFILRASAGEAVAASALTGGEFNARFGADAVPLFYIDGLAVVGEEGGSTVYPVFFRKSELDAYVAAAEARDAAGVAKVRAEGRLETRVVDLTDVVAEIRRGGGGAPRAGRV